ncbi:hypothetical protein GUA46_06495 [Muricauda sp. HICW]|uniref:C1q domain-containing protein n=1 Tax=Flagellimonas chongwuensis TaxID=2697365 RepID=A0A850NBE7_9FLAO|nr:MULTISPECIES: hypothetical protein [Allomuricauda]NVN17983.1 hypothetical protein [Allomuricauda chongwuensis]
MLPYRLKSIILSILLMGLGQFISSQEVRVVDNKGTTTIVRNTSVTAGTVAPSSPILNDIWFDTSNSEQQIVNIWNGSTWQEITFTGAPGSIFFAGSDGTPEQENDRLFWDEVNNRLGIGTALPTQSIDVNGSVRVRTMTQAANSDAILKADTGGVLHLSKVNYGGRWTNTDTSTNLNVNDTQVPIFGTADYVDDGTSLYEVSGNTLIVKEAGRYDIRANIALVGYDGGALYTTKFDTNVNIRIAVNGTPVGAYGASGYISFELGHNHSSVHTSEILELDTNDVISILSYRDANSGSVLMDGSGNSSFIINKLR